MSSEPGSPPAERPAAPSWRARLRGWAVDLAIVGVVLLAVTAWQGRNLLGAAEPAPALALPTLDGGRTALEELRGRKVLVIFWAPWCGVCKQEVGNLNDVARAGGAAFEVISVAVAYRDRADVERFVREQGVRYPVLLGSAEDAERWRVSAFPTAYVIDEQGRIEHAVVGYATELGLRLRLL